MTDSLLTTVLDKTGASIQIFLAQSLSGNATIFPYFLKNYAELIEQGFSHPILVGSNKTKSVYAVIDNQVIAAVVFEIQEDVSKTTWLLLSIVSKEYRKRGIFKILHKILEEVVKSLGSKKIASLVHIDNSAMLASCKSVGRELVFYRTEKQL